MISREEYLSLSDEDRAASKALFKAIRTDRSFGERTRILAWGFVRGFKYRRMERSHKKQYLPESGAYADFHAYGRDEKGKYFEHNLPNALYIAKLLAKHCPAFESEFSGKYSVKEDSRVVAWLKDPTGGIPAPVRVRKPFVRAAE